MAVKRLTRKLTDVIAEVEAQLKVHYNVTQKELDAWLLFTSWHQLVESL